MSCSSSRRSIVAGATGAALVLVGLVTFQAWRVDAVGSDEATFVPITPCRLIDTRFETRVGPRGTPLGTDEEYSLQVTGAAGQCTLPAEATGVAINLTGVGPTEPTFVSIYPDDAPNPGTSVLNMVPGQSPTPNKIDVKLAANGKVKLFNKFGSIHIVGDVLGYYRHDGLGDLEARLAALESAGPDSRAVRAVFEVANIDDDEQTVDGPVLEVPAAGVLTAIATCTVGGGGATPVRVRLGLAINGTMLFLRQDIPANGTAILTTSRTASVNAGTSNVDLNFLSESGSLTSDCTSGSISVMWSRT